MRLPRAARPVLKWAGGKTQLLPEILSRMPARIRTYYEPFVGGGAVFFALAAEGRFRRAVLSDRNAELVDVYRALQTDVDGVVKCLRKMTYSEDEYYRIRDERRSSRLVKRAARTLYLNKTGFNGLYRVNRAGGFNVPFGRHVNPTICDEENLRRVADVLKSVELLEEDFEVVCKRAKKGDVVYLDPPYLPRSRTASFAAYDRHPFRMPEHERLAKVFAELGRRHVHAVLSNSDTPVTRELYGAYRPDYPRVGRAINSKVTARGPITELLVTNGVFVAARP